MTRRDSTTLAAQLHRREIGGICAKDYYGACSSGLVVVLLRGDVRWTYSTVIPHATFDIMDADEIYCRGVVFHAKDTRVAPTKNLENSF
jgi:hypothetical protein